MTLEVRVGTGFTEIPDARSISPGFLASENLQYEPKFPRRWLRSAEELKERGQKALGEEGAGLVSTWFLREPMSVGGLVTRLWSPGCRDGPEEHAVQHAGRLPQTLGLQCQQREDGKLWAQYSAGTGDSPALLPPPSGCCRILSPPRPSRSTTS